MGTGKQRLISPGRAPEPEYSLASSWVTGMTDHILTQYYDSASLEYVEFRLSTDLKLSLSGSLF
jgi:hypothetical protein